MANELVLITGISGFIGYRILLNTLQAGHSVRGIIRGASSIQHIKDTLSLSSPSLLAKLEFVVIADLTVPGVFDEALHGVKYVIHVASPMDKPSDDYLRDSFRPAINMVLNVLTAASHAPSVKRVVVTSSIIPLLPFNEFMVGKFNRPVFRADDPLIPYDIAATYAHPLLAYGVSKTLSLKAAENFIATSNPHFSTVFIMPTLVMGENPLATSAEASLSSTSGLLIKLLLGRPGNPLLGMTVDVRDVAELHVLALDSKVPAGRYLANSGSTIWRDAFGIVGREFPEKARGVFAEENERMEVSANIDAGKTEETFQFKFRSWEEQVKGAVAHYLSLLEKESSK